MFAVSRRCLMLVILIAMLAGCGTSTSQPTPTVVPTEPPTSTPVPPTATSTQPPTATSTQTPKPTNTLVHPTDTPAPTATLAPTNTPVPTKTSTRKPITVTPRATSTPKPPAAPPLADAVRKALKQVESLGGAMDRLYGGGGAEACAPFMADFFGVVGAPQYDVATQPSNVQGAYAAYRQAINLIADKVGSIAEVCLKGGGVPSRLSFDVARMSVNDAGSLLTNALSTLGQ